MTYIDRSKFRATTIYTLRLWKAYSREVDMLVQGIGRSTIRSFAIVIMCTAGLAACHAQDY